MKFSYRLIYSLSLIAFLLSGCSDTPGSDYHEIKSMANIFPDYTSLTLPPNIAPLNFRIKEKGDKYFVTIASQDRNINIPSKDGKIIIPVKEWKELLDKNKGKKLRYDIFVKKEGKWNKFESFTNNVSTDSIDQYIFYRLLYPGYELWKEMGIYGRDITSFTEKPLIENKSVYNNCMNCHSFNQNSPDTYMFHVRGNRGGTIIYKNGKIKKVNVKTKDMMSAGVYPSWHPNGILIAYSTNKIKQLFHAQGKKFIDVFDQASDIIVYDTQTEKVFSDTAITSKKFMETFPCWSPDGKYLYFTRSK